MIKKRYTSRGLDIRKDTLSQDFVVLFRVIVRYRRDSAHAFSPLSVDLSQAESKIFSEFQRRFRRSAMPMARIQCPDVTDIRSIVKDIRLNQASNDVVVES